MHAEGDKGKRAVWDLLFLIMKDEHICQETWKIQNKVINISTIYYFVYNIYNIYTKIYTIILSSKLRFLEFQYQTPQN